MAIQCRSETNMRKVQSRTGIPEISFDLQLEILIRVPAEYLFRLKAVCRDWFNLITSKSFITRHNNHWKHQILVVEKYSPPFSLSFNFKSGDRNTPEIRRQNLWFADFVCPCDHWCSVEDSCCARNEYDSYILDAEHSGLMLVVLESRLSWREHLLLCNPATRFCRSLPLFKQRTRQNWAMCYDSSAGRFFVVVIVSGTFPELSCYFLELHGAVKNGGGKNRTWREIAVPRTERIQEVHISMEGKVYWLLSGGPASRGTTILTIDAAARAAGLTVCPRMPIPKLHRTTFNQYFKSSNGEEFYRLIASPEHELHLWSLKDFKNPAWLKVHVIRTDTIDRLNVGEEFSFDVSGPLLIADEDNKLIAQYGDLMLVYDFRYTEVASNNYH